MANEIEDMLDEEIASGFTKIKEMTPGTNEHTTAVQALERLYKLRQEDIAKNREFMEKSERSVDDEREREVKHKQMIWERIRDGLDIAVKVGAFVVPALVYCVYMDRGYKFEETGTYTSPTMKGLMSWYKPKK